MDYTHHRRTFRDRICNLSWQGTRNIRQRKHLLVDWFFSLPLHQYVFDVQGYFRAKRLTHRNCICGLDGNWRCRRCGCRDFHFQRTGNILAFVFCIYAHSLYCWSESRESLNFQELNPAIRSYSSCQKCQRTNPSLSQATAG